jgi:hypothetical protein
MTGVLDPFIHITDCQIKNNTTSMHINIVLFGILQTPPFVNHNGKDVNSDWLADQSDERSVLGHALNDKGKKRAMTILFSLHCTDSKNLRRGSSSSGENPKDFH